ncbi:31048_t:CDS:1, partial [Racocetra persica]
MAFDDIKIYTASAIAKSGGPTSENFFTINDGFYEFSEMKEFILR